MAIRKLDFYKTIEYPKLKMIWKDLCHGLTICKWPNCKHCLPNFECAFCDHRAQSYGTIHLHLVDDHDIRPMDAYGTIHYKTRVVR